MLDHFLLIENKITNDPAHETQSSDTAQATYKNKTRHTLLGAGVLVAVTFVVGVVSLHTAKASLLGFVASDKIVITHRISADVENSQTLVLLQSATNIDPNPSRGGGEVHTVDDEALVAESTPFSGTSEMQTAPATSDQISLYMVQEGDSLSQVAEMFGVSVNTVVWANELSSNRDIHPGQTLLILPVSGLQYIVEKGDTLKSIAKEYGGDIEDENISAFVEEIIEYNGLADAGSLVVGETITIPGGMMEEEVPAQATSYTAVASASGPSISGYFIHPVPGSVKTQGPHGYNALDFGAGYGTPIRAAAGGTVIVSRVGGWNGGYGNYVVVDHPNGTQTLYAHNSRNAVWQGQSVVQGQVIGYMGSTGRSTGNHLHFEVRGARNPF